MHGEGEKNMKSLLPQRLKTNWYQFSLMMQKVTSNNFKFSTAIIIFYQCNCIVLDFCIVRSVRQWENSFLLLERIISLSPQLHESRQSMLIELLGLHLITEACWTQKLTALAQLQTCNFPSQIPAQKICINPSARIYLGAIKINNQQHLQIICPFPCFLPCMKELVGERERSCTQRMREWVTRRHTAPN